MYCKIVQPICLTSDSRVRLFDDIDQYTGVRSVHFLEKQTDDIQ